MMELTLKDKLRAGEITRWHMVRTSRTQTVAEHSYRVWLLADYLYDRVFEHETNSTGRALVWRWALFHDLTEVCTGDVPTPIKRWLERVTSDTHLWGKVDGAVSGVINSIRRSVIGTPEGYIVKMADLIEGSYFLYCEGVGDHTERVAVQIESRLIKLVESAKKLFPLLKWDKIMREHEKMIQVGGTNVDMPV